MASTNFFRPKHVLTPDERRFFYSSLTWNGLPGNEITDRYIARLEARGIPDNPDWTKEAEEKLVRQLKAAGWPQYIFSHLAEKGLALPYNPQDADDQDAVTRGQILLTRMEDPYSTPEQIFQTLNHLIRLSQARQEAKPL